MDEILTASQVAEILQLNPRTVHKLTKQGTIPGKKIGSGWRFNKTEILQLASVHVPPVQSSPATITPIKEISQINAIRSYRAAKPDNTENS
jgi:excisionase family DNA binding protein